MSDISKIKFSGTDYVIKDSVARDDIGKKVTANGGDISNTKIVTAETITTEFPAPAAGEAPKTFVGKMKKFVEDFKNWKTGVCLLGQIVNNCVSSDTNKPLAAAQGKVLMDLYNVLNTNLKGYLKYVKSTKNITISADSPVFVEIPVSVPDGYVPISASITNLGFEAGIIAAITGLNATGSIVTVNIVSTTISSRNISVEVTVLYKK